MSGCSMRAAEADGRDACWTGQRRQVAGLGARTSGWGLQGARVAEGVRRISTVRIQAAGLIALLDPILAARRRRTARTVHCVCVLLRVSATIHRYLCSITSPTDGRDPLPPGQRNIKDYMTGRPAPLAGRPADRAKLTCTHQAGGQKRSFLPSDGSLCTTMASTSRTVRTLNGMVMLGDPLTT